MIGNSRNAADATPADIGTVSGVAVSPRDSTANAAQSPEPHQPTTNRLVRFLERIGWLGDASDHPIECQCNVCTDAGWVH